MKEEAVANLKVSEAPKEKKKERNKRKKGMKIKKKREREEDQDETPRSLPVLSPSRHASLCISNRTLRRPHRFSSPGGA